MRCKRPPLPRDAVLDPVDVLDRGLDPAGPPVAVTGRRPPPKPSQPAAPRAARPRRPPRPLLGAELPPDPGRARLAPSPAPAGLPVPRRPRPRLKRPPPDRPDPVRVPVVPEVPRRVPRRPPVTRPSNPPLEVRPGVGVPPRRPPPTNPLRPPRRPPRWPPLPGIPPCPVRLRRLRSRRGSDLLAARRERLFARRQRTTRTTASALTAIISQRGPWASMSSTHAMVRATPMMSGIIGTPSLRRPGLAGVTGRAGVA